MKTGNQPILVIGGAGYIGSHCCKALANEGYMPIVLDNFSTGHRAFVRWGPLVEGDIRDRDCVHRAFEEFKPLAVMHFAALALVGPSISDPGSYYDVNVVGTLRLLEAMRATKVSNLVFSSTCAIYGEHGAAALTEEVECRPVNPYGASKLACERMLEDFGRAHEIRSVSLRYFNAAGADPGGEVGELHNPETHLVPCVIRAALQPTLRIEVFGRDYSTPDGTAIRDYIHVSDLAAAHVLGLKYLLEGGERQALNLGTGRGISVEEVIKQVEITTQQQVSRRYVSRRIGDPASLVANPRRARDVLGWQASRNLPEIVKDAFEWHRRHSSL